jgi:hypothetical protein
VSGKYSKPDAEALLKNRGADGFLFKPIELTDLKGVFRKKGKTTHDPGVS